MAEKTTYSCDVCGIEKRDSNHWWKAVEDHALRFFRWDSKISDATPVIHLCGPGCASVKLSQFMGAIPVVSTDPITALAALAQYPPPPQESGSQRPKDNFDVLDRAVAAHRQEMESQPQWTSDFLKGE